MYLERARLGLRAGNTDEARVDADRARSVASNTADRFAMRDVAWFFARGPKELRDPNAALTLAERSVDQRDSQVSLFILAVACYESGEFARAVDAAEAIIEKAGHYSRTRVHFLLAASLWQLGKRALARQWYDRGVEDQITFLQLQARSLIEGFEKEFDNLK
jgi:tetratricopeptide (TPR) repeat protein